MKLWLDAQLSPEMASWIAKQFAIEAVPVRDVGLRDASDVQIFEAAKQADVVLVTKDNDFSQLIELWALLHGSSGYAVAIRPMKGCAKFSKQRFTRQSHCWKRAKIWSKFPMTSEEIDGTG